MCSLVTSKIIIGIFNCTFYLISLFSRSSILLASIKFTCTTGFVWNNFLFCAIALPVKVRGFLLLDNYFYSFSSQNLA